MGFDTLDAAAEQSGGRYWKPEKVGDTLTGDVIDVSRRPLLFKGVQAISTAGNPREEWLVSIQTELRNPDDEDDTGVRFYTFKDLGLDLVHAVNKAKSEAQGALTGAGDRIQIKVTKLAVQGVSGPEHEVKYRINTDADVQAERKALKAATAAAATAAPAGPQPGTTPDYFDEEPF